jgi:glycosyltransferase involved in cell wall biosynthesis
MQNKDSKVKPTILLCSNYAWTILNFRMSLIKSLINDGYSVEVITQFDGYEADLEASVTKVHNLTISRKGLNPIIDLITFFNILFCLYRVKPDAFFAFTIKPVIYGAMASRVMNVPTILTITGLGTAFLLDNWVTKIVQTLYFFALKKVSAVFFQNKSDKLIFINKKLIDPQRAYNIPGSGVDINKFKGHNYKEDGGKNFLLIARMLWDKGVGEYIEAAKIVKSKYPNVNFSLLGPVDVQSRSSISKAQVLEWQESGFIEYLGESDDVKPFINQSSCVVLPSYREGLSRVLLEAGSMGRPLITTNVPGCKELVDEGINGFICEAKNPKDLAKAMFKFLETDFETKLKMGINSRKKIKKEFDINIVCKIYLNILNKIKE